MYVCVCVCVCVCLCVCDFCSPCQLWEEIIFVLLNCHKFGWVRVRVCARVLYNNNNSNDDDDVEPISRVLLII